MEGLEPIYTVVEEVPVGGDWAEAECRWIGYYKYIGARLLNIAYGGTGGTPGLGRGVPKSEEHRIKIGKALKGKIVPQDVKDKVAGTRNPMAKLSEQDVLELITKLCSRGVTKAGLAAEYGINVATIRRIQKGETWHHLGVSKKELPKLYCTALSLPEVVEIRKLYRTGEYSLRALSRLYKCSVGTVSNSITHVEWNNILNDYEPIPILSSKARLK